VKNWRSFFVLATGILLVLVSFIIYGVRVSRTVLPPGSTPEQIQQMTEAYGLDRPILEQYALFLFTFLPGLTLLGIYGTVGLRRQDFQHHILTKGFIILMLITNIVTMLNFLVTAHASIQENLPAFWTSLLVAGLAFANFIFLLVIWNGYKRGAWAFGICSFVVCTLKFVGRVPIFPVIFELSSVFILVYLLRSSWFEMD
jgi:ABC-type dipeptide/oligopeptide/nickel transport system permease component